MKMKTYQFKIVGKDGCIYPIQVKGFTERDAWRRAERKVARLSKGE